MPVGTPEALVKSVDEHRTDTRNRLPRLQLRGGIRRHPAHATTEYPEIRAPHEKRRRNGADPFGDCGLERTKADAIDAGVDTAEVGELHLVNVFFAHVL